MATLRDGRTADQPPLAVRARLRELIDANWTTQAIAVAVQLRLPDMLVDAPRSIETLAGKTACHAPSLLRLLRALTSIGIVTEQPDGCFALTEIGLLLSADAPGSMAAWAELSGTSSWAAWGQLLSCVQSGHSVRKRTTGADGFEHLQHDADAALLFNRAMVSVSQPVAAALASEVDFAGVGHVVDVGGGRGALIAAVLRAHPRIQGTLFDMAHAVDAARAHLAEAGVADRCDVVGGDFFEAVPAGADAYLLKTVLHDWNDERCVVILACCARAMAASGQVLVIERLMPARYAVTAHDQGIARGDLNMLVAQNGRERTLDEYRALFAAAGLVLVRSLTLTVGFSVLSATRN